MLHHFDCPPNGAAEVGSLVFDWDDLAGTVAGPGAPAVLALVRQGWVSYGPPPRASWPLGKGALRSRRDMAALIGHAWAVPVELLADYPELEGEAPEVSYVDSEGVFVVGRDQITY